MPLFARLLSYNPSHVYKDNHFIICSGISNLMSLLSSLFLFSILLSCFVSVLFPLTNIYWFLVFYHLFKYTIYNTLSHAYWSSLIPHNNFNNIFWNNTGTIFPDSNQIILDIHCIQTPDTVRLSKTKLFYFYRAWFKLKKFHTSMYEEKNSKP